jgi:hypothetical protein
VGLIEITLLLFVAVVAVLFHALGQVLVTAVGALARVLTFRR